MTLIYKPFGIVVGILAGLLSKRLFTVVWSKIDEQEPPEATTRDTSWPRLIASSALQGVVFTTTRSVVNRFGAKGFYSLTGFWPGEKRPDPDA